MNKIIKYNCYIYELKNIKRVCDLILSRLEKTETAIILSKYTEENEFEKNRKYYRVRFRTFTYFQWAFFTCGITNDYIENLISLYPVLRWYETAGIAIQNKNKKENI